MSTQRRSAMIYVGGLMMGLSFGLVAASYLMPDGSSFLQARYMSVANTVLLIGGLFLARCGWMSRI